jgi:hypothetical protein
MRRKCNKVEESTLSGSCTDTAQQQIFAIRNSNYKPCKYSGTALAVWYGKQPGDVSCWEPREGLMLVIFSTL